MGIDILGRDQDMSCRADFWEGCLLVAVAFGWEPTGTVPSDHFPASDDWDGNYWSNDWQTVTVDDASAFAAALNRAVTAVGLGQTLKEHEAQTLERFAEVDDSLCGRPIIPISYHLGGMVKIADIASKGSFTIS